MEKFRLNGRVAVVTGASSGLGVHFAMALADAGADLVLGGRRVDRLKDTAQRIRERGGRALCVELDVSFPENCTLAAQSTIDEFGRLDILVNNAGVGSAIPALRETPEQFRDVLDVNLFGAYWMAQAAARVMQSGGTVINIASVLGITTAGLPQAAYTASKAGLIGLTRDLAQQWGKRRGIRVNAIAPGYFASEMTDEYAPEYREKMKERTVLGEFGDADDLAASLVWLASDAARYVVGEVIVIDGGFSIG